jgi:hypothetical protein
VPYFICPNCKERSIDHDRLEGLTQQAVACHHCGFGFLFELLEDYYPAPNTGFVVCDQEARVLAAGRDVFELSGYREQELMGRDEIEALGITRYDGQNPALTLIHS